MSMDIMYITAVFFINFFSLSSLRDYLEIKKNPEVIKKNGTATRAKIRVSIKSPVWVKEAKGEVCIVMTKTAAIRRKKSMPA